MLKFILISIVLPVSILLYAGNLKIQLHPFKITLDNWLGMVGIVLLSAGFVILGAIERKKGFVAGWDKAVDKCMEVVRKHNEENK